MEIFISIFMGGWIIIFGIIFMIAMNHEFKKYEKGNTKEDTK